VWDYLCAMRNAGVGTEWIDVIKKYEAEVLMHRNRLSE
jgi:L-rhamnose isomerase